MPKVIIGILTYNREAQLAATIESLKYLRPYPDHPIEIVVVDNYKEGHAYRVVKEAGIGVPCDYLFEGKHGIPHARNKVVEAAVSRGADFLAFIDDDEEADSYWIFNLLKMYYATKAEIIAGRWITVYPPEIPNWVIQTGFFESPRKKNGIQLTYAATGSILYDMKVFKNWKLTYNEKLALVGGSDTYLAKEVIKKGGRIIYADDAVVREPVSQHRANLDWMIKRTYRTRSNSVQDFFHNEKFVTTIRYFFRTIFNSLSRILFSGLKSLFLRKSEMAKVLIAIVTIAGLFGGLLNIKYKEYKNPI